MWEFGGVLSGHKESDGKQSRVGRSVIAVAGSGARHSRWQTSRAAMWVHHLMAHKTAAGRLRCSEAVSMTGGRDRCESHAWTNIEAQANERPRNLAPFVLANSQRAIAS